MPEHDYHKQRVKRLLAQDPEINDKQMEEFRMQLEQSLEACEQKAQRARRRIFIGLAVYIGSMVVCMFLVSQWREAAPNPMAGFARGLIYLPFLVSAMTAGIVGLWLIARYIFVYAPQLTRARFDLQTSILLELQQQMKLLRENMERRDK